MSKLESWGEKFEKAERHDCCWHAFRGPLMMVIPDGYVVQKCCGCQAMRTIHAEHAHERA